MGRKQNYDMILSALSSAPQTFGHLHDAKCMGTSPTLREMVLSSGEYVRSWS